MRTCSSAFRRIRQYLSLNLAMAVQLVAYELFRGARSGSVPCRTSRRAARHAARRWSVYAHLAQVMDEVDFRDRTQSGTNLMTRIRRFFQRAELDQNEVNILRGFLTAVQNRSASGWRQRRMTAPDLPRLRGHDAGGSARRAGDERVSDGGRIIRQRRRPRRTCSASARQRASRRRARRWRR